jgi:hypothetical protein
MKRFIVRTLLAILNSAWLNNTPCKYAFCGNVDNFSGESLRCEVNANPDITVAQLLLDAERFKSCSLRSGVTVIDGDEVRDADVWDVHELRNLKG